MIVSVGPLDVPGSVQGVQHIDGLILERPAQGDDLGQQLGHSAADQVDQLDHQCASLAAIGVPVDRDHPLLHRPCHLNLDVGIDDEQRLEPVLLLLGEEIRTGAQEPPRPV